MKNEANEQDIEVDSNNDHQTHQTHQIDFPHVYEKISVAKNKSTLIPYRVLPEERQEVYDTIKVSEKYLPAFLISLGAYELFGSSIYKSAFMEMIGSIGQSYLHVMIIFASQAFSYPPVAVGIATGLVIILFIYQFAMTSGAHFNSLITISAMTSGHLPAVRGLLYIGFQVLGWYIGAEIMRASLTREQVLGVNLGACNPGDKSYSQMFSIEFTCSLLLLFPVYGTALNLRQREIYGPIYPPILIGVTLGLLIFGSAALGPLPFTGAGMNPSLCSGISLSLANVAGADYNEVFKHHSVYWLAPIAASVSNSILYLLMPPHHETIEMKS